MSLYCFVNPLKHEHVDDYCQYHENAHETEWKSQIKALKAAGFEECNVYVWNDLSIVILGCDDLDMCLTKLGSDGDNIRWQKLMTDFFALNPKFDGTENVTARKIFDLKQQTLGYLNV